MDITPLVEKFAPKLRAAIVIGTDREPVLAALASAASQVPVFEVTTEDNAMVMSTVVGYAAQVAKPGDTVLLAPASASMDQFKDYADRGNQFAAAVQALLEQGGRSNG